MRRQVTGAGLLLLTAALVAPLEAEGAMLRYTLVIGNNIGVDPELGKLPPLSHAEEEATNLREKLIQCCSFDPKAERSTLLLRPTRAQLAAAIEKIAAQMKSDKETLPDVESMFAFFFTGHGLKGRLLLADGPIEREELRALFHLLHPDLTIGMIDACFSGSLDPEELINKGIRPTPGINVVRDLPDDMLDAKGSIWFLSSGPNEASYEDREFGGVFTHFFIEALADATQDGPAITLDQIWRYVQMKTVSYTASRSRAQKPQEITRMKAKGPLYFSFPRERDATLSISNSIGGTLLLSYGEGQLSQMIDKAPGSGLDVHVFPGKAKLLLLDRGQVRAEEDVILTRGDRVVISDLHDKGAAAGYGERAERLWSKGIGEERVIEAVAIVREAQLLGGLGYEYGLGTASHTFLERSSLLATARVDRGPWVFEGGAGWAFESHHYPAWGYRYDGALAKVRAGYGWDVDTVRVAALGVVGGGPLFERFDDGSRKTAFQLQAGGAASLLHALGEHILVEVIVEAGGAYGSVPAKDVPAQWNLWLSGSVVALIPIF